jgi:TP901 family phage tail tape measure protein
VALDAGSVAVTLKGELRPEAFVAYGERMKKAAVDAEATEARISASSNRLAASGKKISQGFANTVGFKSAALGIGAIGIALGETIKTAVDFEKSMRNVNSIAKLSEPQFKSLSKSVLELSGKTAQAPKTLSDGLYQLVSSGFKAKDALTILKSTAIAATAGLTDTGTATTAVAGVLNAYKLKASDAAHVSDVLFQTVKDGVIEFPTLANTIGTVLPFATNLGVKLEDVGASLSTLTVNGIQADNATTDLKNLFAAFLKPSDDLSTAIRKTGFESGTALVKAKGFQGALEAVRATTDGTGESLSSLFPDIRAFGAAADLSGKNAAAADREVKAFQNTTGATAGVFKEQSKSVAVQVQQLQANLAVLKVEVGTAFLPTLNKATKGVSDFLNELNTGTGTGGKLGDDLKSIADHVSDANSEFAQLKQSAGPVISVIGDIAGAAAKAEGHLGLEKLKDDLSGLAGVFELLDGIFTGSPGKIFGGLEKTLGAVTSDFLATFSTILNGAATFAGAMSHIPGIGGAFKDVAAGARAAADAIDGVRDHLRHLGDQPASVKVTADEKDAVNALQHVEHLKLDDKVMKILGKDVSASSKIKQIEHLGIDDKTAKILANIAPALAGVSTAKAAIAGIQDHTVVVNVITRGTSQIGSSVSQALSKAGKHATGRGPGGAETALVGEGNGPELVGNPDSGWTWVTQPTLMGLAPGDAVIPSDPQYAGRALAFMFGAMGIPGYAAGRTAFGSTLHPTVARKPAAKKVLPVPAAVKYGAVSEDDLKNSRDNARESYQKRKERVHNLDVSIREQKVKVREAKAGKAKRAAQAKLDQLARDRHHYNDGGGGLASVNTLHNRYLELNREVGVLHRYNLDIDRLNTRQETDRTRMDTASKTGNAALWTSARTDRNSILAQLRDRYAKALKLAKPGSSFADQLDSQLAGIQSDIADAAQDVFTPDLTPAQQAAQDAADREAQSGLTDAEQQRLDQLHANVSLASLTPDTADDQSAAQELQSFLAGVLQEVQADTTGARGGAASVADIADQLKQAQDNVASFTSAASANSDQNLQAQLDQANTALAVSEREAQINAQALTVFKGWNAQQQPAPNITIQTLHPGDPATLSAIAEASVAGMSLQAYQPSPRTVLGL